MGTVRDTGGRSSRGAYAGPDLEFAVEGVEAVRFAAVPTLSFDLRIESRGQPVRSVVLDVQVRIDAAGRRYAEAERERLLGLFGESRRWSTTLRSLLWTRTSLQVPPFSGSTVVEMPVVCTYDLEVAAARYFSALEGGEVPLEFLFSGTVFYEAEDGRLQASRISWEKEARFGMPVGVWREMIEHHFPDSAWLRLRRDVFERLHAYRVREGCLSWEETVESLIQAKEGVGR
ncbi:DUF6084 family protein [Rubrobacter naiadicus]|uniref:DUF6084 family protein n=1 Tax=Rubrobacter naiadicus TaxID=1392641 RepID=UPI00235FE97E|nr:DUF6084 family protein [Rubrobacter naiadicus]